MPVEKLFPDFEIIDLRTSERQFIVCGKARGLHYCVSTGTRKPM